MECRLASGKELGKKDFCITESFIKDGLCTRDSNERESFFYFLPFISDKNCDFHVIMIVVDCILFGNDK